MTMSRTGLEYGCESHNEHGKSEQLDASLDVLRPEVCVAGLAMRNDLARSLLLTRNTGTTQGVHTRRAQTLQ